MIFTYELARGLAERQLPVVANVLDPGIVDTELQRYLPTPAPTAVMRFAKSPKQGAETSVMLALEKTKTSGGYWVDGKKAKKREGDFRWMDRVQKKVLLERCERFWPAMWFCFFVLCQMLWRSTVDL